MTEKRPIALSWSGGKDSSLALAALRSSDDFEPVALLTSITQEYDRVSIHGVRRELLMAQADSLGLPLYEVTLHAASSNDAYEAAFLRGVAEMRRALPRVAHMAFGDLFLEDVRAYRERLMLGTGLSPVFPLWERDTTSLAREFVDAGFVAHLVCVDTTALDAAFAGRKYDHALLGELPASVDQCGERGEFHTFVSGGPIFRRPVPVDCGEIVLREERFAYCDLLPASARAGAAT